MIFFEVKRLSDKYRPLFLGLLLLSFLSGNGQTYNPSTCCTVSNKAYGAAQAVSTDGRSWFYDATNFVMRDYNGTTEVFSYLNLAKYRSGHFPVFVHSGGILQGNGVWLGGSTLVYWFKDSTGNANLVRWYTDSTGIPGGPFYAVANNLSEGNAGLIKGNLALDLVNNTSDAQKNAASVSLTNHTIDANSNTLLHIPNSALTNNSIGLNITANVASDISVTTTPAALGTNLVVNMPNAGTASRGLLNAANWNFFNGKLDSIHVSNDSVYNCVNGTCTLQSVIVAGGAVNSVNGTNTSLLFSPSTGNVLGQVNPAYAFNWTGQHTFTSFAPIFSTLTTANGIFYGNGIGQLLQTGAGTTGQIFQSNGISAPTFFTPNASTVNGWLGYTALSNALGSTHLFVGNGSNVATDVALSGDASLLNTGAITNTGLKANALPPLTPGNLGWTGLAWTLSGIVGGPNLQHTAVLGDTLNKIYAGIPQPTGTGVNGDPINWTWLTGGGHFFVGFDSLITVSGGSELQFGFPTAQAVAFGITGLDEKTFPLIPDLAMDLDRTKFSFSLPNAGIGINLVGDGTTWQTQSAQLGGFTFAFDTSTVGIFSFDLVGNYLGASTNGTLVQYTGSNGYTLRREWSGLVRNFRYTILDAAGNPVLGHPQATDRMTIFNGTVTYSSVDVRQFLTATNPYFVGGLPNFWTIVIVKEYPDSLKIAKPGNFTATPVSTTQVNLAWNAVANAATGYELRRSLTPNFSSETVIYRNTATSFNDTGRTTGTTYYYRLNAIRTVIGGNDVHSGWEMRSATTP